MTEGLTFLSIRNQLVTPQTNSLVSVVLVFRIHPKFKQLLDLLCSLTVC